MIGAVSEEEMTEFLKAFEYEKTVFWTDLRWMDMGWYSFGDKSDDAIPVMAALQVSQLRYAQRPLRVFLEVAVF